MRRQLRRLTTIAGRTAAMTGMTATTAIVTTIGVCALAPVALAGQAVAPSSSAASSSSSSSPIPTTPTPTTTTAAPTTTAPAPTPAPPTRLAKLPPSTISDGAQPLTVTLSAPVYATSPAPMLAPAVAGHWRIVGDSEVFTPASTLEPCSDYALTVWAGTTSTAHAPLGRRQTIRLHVACPPLAGLQQALARLGYLGAKLDPVHDEHIPAGRETRAQAAAYAFHPPRGQLAPDPADAPPVAQGQLDTVTRGALEVYQADNRLPVSGVAEHATWASLLYDESAGRRDPQPYTWVTVSESEPERLYLHRGDRVAFTTLVNTGVAGAETQTGTFPIYARYVSTSMSGEDPDGTKYDVADVPWVNYFNGGDAVHGYPRAAYGFPQSNGCVELPIEAARIVYGMLQIGDLVQVMG